MTTYEREDALVERNEAGLANRIETSGAYVGRIVLARERIAGTGTKGIDLAFEADDGRVARNMTLWIERANGERIPYFYGLLSSLMVCLGLDKITSSQALVEEWNPESGQRQAVQREVFSELTDRPLGIVLQREESTWEGQARVAMKPVGFFDPRDRSVASEILDGSRAGKGLDRLLQTLKEKVIRSSSLAGDDFTKPATGPAPSFNQPARPEVVDNFADEDIPF